ncbi:hypothetical protein [Mycobacterium sp.]
MTPAKLLRVDARVCDERAERALRVGVIGVSAPGMHNGRPRSTLDLGA